MASLTHAISMPCTMKVRVNWPNTACSLHLKVGVERPKFSPHDFAGELTQTTTDHVPRPFFPTTQNKNGKKRSGNARLSPTRIQIFSSELVSSFINSGVGLVLTSYMVRFSHNIKQRKQIYSCEANG